MRFVDNPVTHPTLTAERVAEQAEAMAGGRTLAYCASGTRSSILWSLAKAGELGADGVTATLATARLSGLDAVPGKVVTIPTA